MNETLLRISLTVNKTKHMYLRIRQIIPCLLVIISGAISTALAEPICINDAPILATLKGFSCPCVKTKKCVEYKAKSCSITTTPAGSYCDAIDAGPAQDDECHDNGSDPNAKCNDPNQGSSIACYKLRTGTCVVQLYGDLVPYQECSYSSFNVDSGIGQVYFGPECPN